MEGAYLGIAAGQDRPSVTAQCRPSLGNSVVVLDGPLSVTSGTPNGGIAEGGVTHTQNSKLGRQAIQIHANAVEVGIGGAASQRGGDRILRGGGFGDRFLERVQQDGIDISPTSTLFARFGAVGRDKLSVFNTGIANFKNSDE
jgi:hypothetical protein